MAGEGEGVRSLPRAEGGGWRWRRRSEATQAATGRWLVAVGPDGRTDRRAGEMMGKRGSRVGRLD